MSKADRYTLWQRAENLILDVIEGILLASQLSKTEKLPHLERVSTKLNVLRIFLRLAKDTKLLDLKKCLLLQEIVDEIGRMLGGWMKSLRENKNSLSPGSLRERVVEANKKELPEAAESDVRIVVVIGIVVDVEPVRIEVPGVDAVTFGVDIVTHSRLIAPEVEVYRLAAYILFFLYFIREHPVATKRLYGNLR